MVELDVLRIFRMRYQVQSFAFLADDANADGHESSIPSGARRALPFVGCLDRY